MRYEKLYWTFMVISGWWWDSMRLWDCLSVDKWDWTCRTVRGERGAQGEKSLLVSSSPHLHFSPNLNICTPNLVHLFLKSRWYTRIILMLILALALWPGVSSQPGIGVSKHGHMDEHCDTWAELAYGLVQWQFIFKKIPHTGDTNSLDRCG